MSVVFVIGRAGSGKTRRCFSRIVAALQDRPIGPPLYWLLPRQATFAAEHRLTCGSHLPGFCRARVVSFAQLGREILGETGGADAADISTVGRQMILGHLLRVNGAALTFFTSVDRQAGLAAELARTFDELERAGKTSADLALLLDDLGPASMQDVEARALRAKLADVRLLYDAYNDFLGKDRLDPNRRQQQIRKAVADCPFIAGAVIYVDAFYEFTDHERQMLVALAQAGASLEITLAMDPASPLLVDPHQLPDEMSLFHRTETTFRRLWFAFTEADVEVAEPLRLGSPARFASPALSRLERSIFSDREASEITTAALPRLADAIALESPAPFAALRRIEAPDRAAEVDFCAREIRARLMDGERLRDIAVLTRSLGAYRSLLASSFSEHHIPFFVDMRRDGGSHPLVQFLRAALAAARFDWRREAVITLMKTGLAGLCLDEADELENYILLHRVRSERWQAEEPWSWRRDVARGGESDAENDDPPRVDVLRRRVGEGLGPLARLLSSGERRPIRVIAAAVYAMFERFAVRQTLGRWIEAVEAEADRLGADAGDRLEERDEHEQVWKCLVELFDQLVELLGDQEASPGDFVDIVESGLEQLDLGITPATLDQVLVGAVDRTRCPPVKTVFVLGLNEGEFPARPNDSTVLTDRDRREMDRRQLPLDPHSGRRLLDERFLGYIAMTQPSRRLILTRCLADDSGHETASSMFWREIDALFPGAGVERVAREGTGAVEQVATPRQLVAGLMRWSRDADADPAHHLAWLGLYDWFQSAPDAGESVSTLRNQAWPALSYSNNASLSPAIGRQLHSAPLALDAARLETMAQCPFRHFARYELGLAARGHAGVGAGDVSQIHHRVLDLLLSRHIAAARWDNDPARPFAPTAEAIGAAVATAAASLRGELMLSTARNRYLLRRIERTITLFVISQQAFLRRGRLRPALTSVSFGRGHSAIAALPLPGAAGGALATVGGRIDRIDASATGATAVLYDYSLAVKTLSLERTMHGLSLQLLLAVAALRFGKLSQGKPRGAFHLPLLRPLQSVAHPSEALAPNDDRYLLKMKPRGIFDADILGDLDAELTGGESTTVSAFLKPRGEMGRPDKSDAIPSEHFTLVIRGAERTAGALAKQIADADVAITPFRLGQESPCAECDYRSVCRFETSTNRYRRLDRLDRAAIISRLQKEGPA